MNRFGGLDAPSFEGFGHRAGVIVAALEGLEL